MQSRIWLEKSHGQHITFKDDGTVTIDMKDYVTEVLNAFPEKLKASVSSPAR